MKKLRTGQFSGGQESRKWRLERADRQGKRHKDHGFVNPVRVLTERLNGTLHRDVK